MLEDKIKHFLSIDFNYGSGDGTGYGYVNSSGDGDSYCNGDSYSFGYGSGYGYGAGNGYGFGYGYGYGSGYCYRCNYGIKSVNENKVYIVDNMPTLIYTIKGNIAQGGILNNDLTITPCCIVKGGNKFAHGQTLHEAFTSLQNKLFLEYPEEERIEKFKETYPDADIKIPAKELYEWHNRLTGSCKMGRLSFVQDNGIDIENDSFTTKEFVDLTKHSYGGDIISKLI